MEIKETEKIDCPKHKVLNVCVFAFTIVLTLVAMISFFVALFTDGNYEASSIASMYILCMLLAAPTLKVFLDKVSCPVMRRLNIIGIIAIFIAILLSAAFSSLVLAFPSWF